MRSTALLGFLLLVSCGGRQERQAREPAPFEPIGDDGQPPCGIPSSEEHPWPCGAPAGIQPDDDRKGVDLGAASEDEPADELDPSDGPDEAGD